MYKYVISWIIYVNNIRLRGRNTYGGTAVRVRTFEEEIWLWADSFLAFWADQLFLYIKFILWWDPKHFVLCSIARLYPRRHPRDIVWSVQNGDFCAQTLYAYYFIKIWSSRSRFFGRSLSLVLTRVTAVTGCTSDVYINTYRYYNFHGTRRNGMRVNVYKYRTHASCTVTTGINELVHIVCV